MKTELDVALETIARLGSGNTVHPSDLDAVHMLALDVMALAARARRLGLRGAGTTLEFVSDAIEQRAHR